MKLTRKSAFILSTLNILICFFFTNLSLSAQKPSTDISIVEGLEIDWHNAYVTHNINLISNVLADDFINLGRTGGRNTRQQTLENFRNDSAIYEYCTPFDLEYRLYDQTIIVLCKSKEKGTANGITFSATYFSQDIFVKENGKWKCVLASVGKMPEKK